MTTRVVTTHVPSELAKQLDGLADRLDRPKSWVVKEAIVAYIAIEEARQKLTEAALADVDAGAIVPHREVVAWAAAKAKPKRSKSR